MTCLEVESHPGFRSRGPRLGRVMCAIDTMVTWTTPTASTDFILPLCGGLGDAPQADWQSTEIILAVELHKVHAIVAGYDGRDEESLFFTRNERVSDSDDRHERDPTLVGEDVGDQGGRLDFGGWHAKVAADSSTALEGRDRLDLSHDGLCCFDS